jgi:hypothetical protein
MKQEKRVLDLRFVLTKRREGETMRHFPTANFSLRGSQCQMSVYENLSDILKWLTFYLLVFAGAYAAIRVPVFRAFRIPEGLRIVFGIEAVGLLIATSVHILSGFPGLRAMGREMLMRVALAFSSGEQPQTDISTEGA